MNIKNDIMKNSGVVINEMALSEMAKADLPKDYDSPEDFLAKYKASYEKRMGKDFSPAAVAGLKKTLKDSDLPDAEEIIAAAEKKYPKSAKSRGGKTTFTPEQLKAGEEFIKSVGAENAVKVINALRKKGSVNESYLGEGLIGDIKSAIEMVKKGIPNEEAAEFLRVEREIERLAKVMEKMARKAKKKK